MRLPLQYSRWVDVITLLIVFVVKRYTLYVVEARSVFLV